MEPTQEQIKKAGEKADANMKEALKDWHPTDLRALENLRYSYNNFIPNKKR